MRDLITRLQEDRAKAWASYKAFLDDTDKACRADKRDLTEEEQSTDRQHLAGLDALDERINDLTNRFERSQERDEQREQFEELYGRDAEREEARVEQQQVTEFREFLQGQRPRVDVDLRGLTTVVDEYGRVQVRDLTVGTAAAGGNTVPTSFRRQLYEHLIENSGIRRTNVTVLTTESGENIQVPKSATAGTAAIVGEGTALAENDPTFGQVTLGAWKYGQLLQVSNELITDTGVDLLGFLARDAGRAIANASGAHFVTGSGTNQPLGVMTAAGTGVTGATGQVGAPNGNDLIDLAYSVDEPYANNAFWFMRRATEGGIRKLKDDNGQYIWQPSVQVGTPNTLLGRPVITDPNVAATGSNALSVAFGDFQAYFIRDVGMVRFERSDHFAFSSDLVTYRAILRSDGDLVDLTGAIKVYKGGTQS